jgi:hypothetical protein
LLLGLIFFFLIFLNEKARPIAEIDIIPGTIKRFCENIPNIENRNPLNPYSNTKKPTENPNANPLNKTIIGTIIIPTNSVLVIQITKIALKLSINDCFNIEILFILDASIDLNKEFTNNIILLVFSGSSTLIAIAPTIIPIKNIAATTI